MIDLEGLNPQQREAVETTEGPLLVLAGAGSGKTRVLTYRIAHLIEECGVAPWEVLAITFTNKAAAEMRDRLGNLVGSHARGMWVSTFHSMCVRILRADARFLGFTSSFTICDEDDSKRLVKSIMSDLDIDQKRIPLAAVRGKISTAKNQLIVPADFEAQAIDPIARQAARVYVELQRRLKAQNSFDFDDLLLYAYLLLKHHPEVLDAYQQRFKYLLVDEYQDTNKAQYAITTLLAAAHRNIMVVGDDDQSIYSWRGADIRNILDFESDYPEARVIKLEQNYRSTAIILKAANSVIANNQTRKSKRLFTEGQQGDKIQMYVASDERDEGRWIAGEIERLHRRGESYANTALFYRTNAQSRVLEDMMLRAGVPYRIIGGVRFFDRAEIRDVMAYLTLVVNPADNLAAHRVINTPKRGIGKTTIEHIENVARDQGITFLQAAQVCIADEEIRRSTRTSLASFVKVVMEADAESSNLRAVVEAIIDASGLVAELEAIGTDEALGRIENIKELMSVVDEFSETHQDEDALYEAPKAGDAEASDEEPVRVLRGESLADFIEWVRLRTDLDSAVEGESSILMMTVHASKGLEFDNVFVAGMEESLFPHGNSRYDPEGIEEERRLAYVAITRARKRLYLTCAQSRQMFGETSANPVSRFVREIPPGLLMKTGLGSSGLSGTGYEKRGSRRGISGSGSEAGSGRVFDRSSAHGSRTRDGSSGHATSVSSLSRKSDAASITFRVGQKVHHATFGSGKVVKIDGDTVSVKFAKTGQTKRLLKDYAPLTVVE